MIPEQTWHVQGVAEVMLASDSDEVSVLLTSYRVQDHLLRRSYQHWLIQLHSQCHD